MREAGIEAVLFDLFHTLVDVNDIPGPTTATLLGIDPGLWNRTMLDRATHHALGTETDPVASIRRVAATIDPAIPEEAIRRAAEARPARFRRALTEIRPDVLSSLERLRSHGLKMGLLSNAGLDEIGAWSESPLAPFFDCALFSCHEKLMKPDVAFYGRAARRLGVPSGRCLYVGDGGSREHEGARGAGMRTVLILGMLEKSLPEIAATRPRNTDWIVRTMEELVELIESLRGPERAPDPGGARR